MVLCVFVYACVCASKQQNDYCEHSSRCLATESLCFLGNSCLALAVWVIGSLDNGDGVTLDLACWMGEEKEGARNKGEGEGMGRDVQRQRRYKVIIILHCNHPPACFIRRRQYLSSWGPSSNTIHSAVRACTDTLFLGGEPRQALHISSIITQRCLVHSPATLCLLSFVICYILCSVGMNEYWTPKNMSQS